MHVWQGTEKNVISIPATSLLGPTGQLEIDAELLKYVDIAKRKQNIVVRAKEYIGQFRLNDKHMLVISSGLPESLVRRILSYSGAGRFDVLEAPVELSGSSEGFDALIELIEAFSLSLRSIRTFGLWKKYRRTQTEGSSIQGRLLFPPSIKRRWSRNMPYEAVSEHHSISPSIPENQLIKRATSIALGVLRVRAPDSRSINLLLSHLQEFSAVHVGSDEEVRIHAQKTLSDERKVPQNRLHYKQILLLAAWIVRAQAYDPAGHLGRDEGGIPSLAFNMADFFEHYIRQILKSHLSEAGYETQDGNHPAVSRPLFVDSAQPIVKPDLVLSRQGHLVAVGDVKYKPRFHESDRYQVLTHAKAYGVRKAFVIRPEPCQSSQVAFTGTLGHSDPIEFSEIVLGVESANPEEQEAELARLIQTQVLETNEVNSSAPGAQ